VNLKKRNVVVIIQTRDLDDIRDRLVSELGKFDRTAFEVMPGVWHLATTADLSKIRFELVGAVTDYEDDRMLVIDNSDGFADWGGHRGQHVRGEELCERFVRNLQNIEGKHERYLRKEIKAADDPEWGKASHRRPSAGTGVARAANVVLISLCDPSRADIFGVVGSQGLSTSDTPCQKPSSPTFSRPSSASLRQIIAPIKASPIALTSPAWRSARSITPTMYCWSRSTSLAGAGMGFSQRTSPLRYAPLSNLF
jgi:hypothetical protein